ncbi:MAG: hypothetical protein ACRD50_06475 [Candidatus Acidiferrales bacterium]
MKSRILSSLALAILGVLAATAIARADTLEMRDGRLIQGKFLGGTESNVRFLVDGKEGSFDVKDIVNLAFSAPEAASTAPVDASATAPAAPAEATTAPPAAVSTPAEAVPENPQPPNQATIGVTIPAGTSLLVRMIDSVDSSKNHVGDRFHASLEDNLNVNETLVAPKGADVYGQLIDAKAAGHISGAADLRLQLTGIRIGNSIQPILTSDYDVAGKGRGKQSAERIGGGAVLGAIIGGIAGGGKGAAIGAGIGAGAGTAVQIATHGEQVKIPSETLLEFHIEQPVSVNVPQ